MKYKFMERSITKSYEPHDIKNFVKAEKDYLDQIANNEGDIDQSCLQSLLKAYLNLERFDVHPSVQQLPV